MGADFIYAWIPNCDITEERRKELDAIVEAVTEFPDFEDSLEAWKGRLNDALDSLDGGSREVSVLELPGADYSVLLTGGMSWGDEPTDAMRCFSAIGDCNELFEKLAEWARADKPKPEPTRESTYLARRGKFCPYCESRNIDVTGMSDHDGDGATYEVECDECGALWNDVYTLSGIEEVSPPKTAPAKENTDANL